MWTCNHSISIYGHKSQSMQIEYFTGTKENAANQVRIAVCRTLQLTDENEKNFFWVKIQWFSFDIIIANSFLSNCIHEYQWIRRKRTKNDKKKPSVMLCSPRLRATTIIIVFNLGTIRLQWTQKKHNNKTLLQWQKTKFTFPFWKLRKTELFYLQLFFDDDFPRCKLLFFHSSGYRQKKDIKEMECVFLFEGRTVVLFIIDVGVRQNFLGPGPYFSVSFPSPKHVNQNWKWNYCWRCVLQWTALFIDSYITDIFGHHQNENIDWGTHHTLLFETSHFDSHSIADFQNHLQNA